MSMDFELYGEIDLGGDELYRVCVFDRNITHNLAEMAEKAGIYDALWCGEEKGFSAGDIVTTLENGVRDLRARPLYYRQFEASNGWGLYDHFVPFVAEILEACQKYPKAKVWVSK